MKDQWIREDFGEVVTAYKVRNTLHREKTPFQNMQLVDTCQYGRMLLLDGMVQTTEKDEFVYHEMLTHVPLLAHPRPRKVLVIGGGDGGILREVLKHQEVHRATLVEIDKRVIDFSIKHMPKISGNCFGDKRVEVVIGDGAKFVASTNEKYDVVIVDSSDPIGPATVLFSKKFYAAIKGLLTPKGIMICQTGSTFMQPAELKEAYRLLSGLYEFTAPYVFAVPTYIGGFFSCIFSSVGINPLKITESKLERKFDSQRLRTKYYNPGVHIGAFKTPEYVKGIINNGKPSVIRGR